MIRKMVVTMLTLAAIATGVLWVSSHRTWKMWAPRALGWHAAVLVDKGQATLLAVDDHTAEYMEVTWHYRRLLPDYFRERFVFRYYRNWIPWKGGTLRTRHVVVRCPLWPASIALLAYPAVALARGPFRRCRRLKRGVCVICGYNLTGLPNPRCPECGTPF